MNSTANGLTATLLMFVPLLAVPFLAAFGVSMPTQDIAAGAVELESLEFAPETLEPDVGHSATARRTPADLFAPLNETGENTLPPVSTPNNPQAMSHPLSLPDLESQPPAGERVDESSQPTSLVVNTPTGNIPTGQPNETNWKNPFENSPAFGSSTPSESLSPHQEPAQPESFASPTEYPQDFADSPANSPKVANGSQNPFDWNAESTGNETASNSPPVDDSVFGPPGSSVAPTEPLTMSNPSAPTGRTLFGPPESGDRRVGIPDPQRTPPRQPEVPSNTGWESEPTPPVQPPTSPAGTRTQKPQSWVAARQRLQELNITKFSLQPAENDRLFYFRCVSASPNNPRVTRNFEASGREPLEAVGRVLSQVEQWRASN